MDIMAQRGIHVVVITLVLAAGVAALKWWQKRKAGRAQSQLALEAGKVSMVYFHAPTCGVCRTSQRPILDKLVLEIGANRLGLVAVDVTERAEVARSWGVTTIPSIYVIGPTGKVTHVNNGLTREPTLRQQVSSLA